MPAVTLPPIPKTEVITDEKGLLEMKQYLTKKRVWAFDTETTSLNPVLARMVMLSVATEERAFVIPTGIPFLKKQLRVSTVVETLKPIFENPSYVKVAHNAKYDMEVLENHGIHTRNHWCTMIGGFLCNENIMLSLKVRCKFVGMSMSSYANIAKDNGAKGVSGKTGFIEAIQATPKQHVMRFVEYAADDAIATYRLYMQYKEQLEVEGLEEVFRVQENPMSRVCCNMERRGVLINMELLDDVAEKVVFALEEIEKRLYKSAGKVFNPSSNPQKAEILYEEMGFPVMVETPAGKPSTNKEALQKLADAGHEFPALLLEYSKLQKLHSSYTSESSALCRNILSSGRVHGSFNSVNAITGRFSCVAGWTPIVTQRGPIPIQDVELSDRVWTHKGRWRPVLDRYIKGIEQMYTVCFDNGEKLTCTRSHKLLCSDGTWKTIGGLLDERFKKVDIRRAQSEERVGALQEQGLLHGTSGSREVGDDVSQRTARFEDVDTERRVESTTGDEVFPVEGRGEKSHEGEDRKETSQLGRGVRGREGLPHVHSQRASSVRSSCRGREDVGHRRTPEEFGRSSRRRRQEEQRPEQPCYMYKEGAQAVTLYAGEGQQSVGVEKIYVSESYQVYDITVGEDESYLSCGVFSHNSSNPNLQQIPQQKEDSEFPLRSIFVAPKGKLLICADYSQIELRMIAHYTKDPVMMDAFLSGGDLHQATMDNVGCDRKTAKGLNFGLSYGTGPNTLSKLLKCSVEEARAYHKAYFQTYAHLAPFRNAIVKHHKKRGYIKLVSGRKRRVMHLDSRDDGMRAMAERQVFNSLIQGSCADLMKRALIDIEDDKILKHYGCKLLMTVHDEVVLEVDQKFAMPAVIRLRYLMEQDHFGLRVPLIADVEVGGSWGTAKP